MIKTIATLLFGLVDLAPARVLVALGMGFVSFTGVTAVLNSLVQDAQSGWASITAVPLQIASLAGIPEALGIVFGAAIARSAFSFLPRLARIGK